MVRDLTCWMPTHAPVKEEVHRVKKKYTMSTLPKGFKEDSAKLGKISEMRCTKSVLNAKIRAKIT